MLDRRPLVPIFLGAIAAGIAIRIYTLLTPLGALDSDEAIVGLMAMHFLDGEFSVFYWGQTYGGAIDAFLTAPLVALFGAGTFAIKLVSLLLSALAALLIFLIGCETVGRRAGAVGAMAFWLWPSFFVWWSTKSRGGHYWPGFVLTLMLVLLLLRAHRESGPISAPRAAVMGLVFGLAWWAGPQVIYLALPVALYVWATNRKLVRFRSALTALAGAIAGASPWIYENLRTSLASFRIPLQPDSTYLGRLGRFFTSALPKSLDLRASFSEAWVADGAGLFIYVLVLGVAAVLLIRRPKETRPLLVVLVAYPFLFAISPFSWYTSAPQYLLFLSPVTSLLLGWLVTRSRFDVFAPLALVIVSGLTLIGLRVMRIEGHPAPFAPDVQTPVDLEPLIAGLEELEIDAVFADYWVAYRITFVTEEKIVASPIFSIRRPSYFRAVSADDLPAYVIVKGSGDAAELRRRLRLGGIGYREVSRGGFLIFLPETKVLPSDLPV